MPPSRRTSRSTSAEAEPLAAGPGGGVPVVQHPRLERPRPVVRGQPRPGVADLEPHHVPVPRRRQHQDAAGRAHPDGVVGEGVDDLPDPSGVRGEPQRAARQLQAYVDAGAPAALGPDDPGLLDQRRQVHRREVEGEVVGLEPGQREQVGDVALQPLCLRQHRPSHSLRLVAGDGAVGQPLRQPADRRERRTQLVGDRQQELALAGLAGGQRLVEAAQGVHDVADLTGAGRRQRQPPLAGGHPPREVRGPRQGPGQPRPDDDGSGQREDESEGERQQDAPSQGRGRRLDGVGRGGEHDGSAALRRTGLDQDGHAVEGGAGRHRSTGEQALDLARRQRETGAAQLPGRGEEPQREVLHVGPPLHASYERLGVRQLGQELGLPGQRGPGGVLGGAVEERGGQQAGCAGRHRRDQGHRQHEPRGQRARGEGHQARTR